MKSETLVSLRAGIIKTKYQSPLLSTDEVVAASIGYIGRKRKILCLCEVNTKNQTLRESIIDGSAVSPEALEEANRLTAYAINQVTVWVREGYQRLCSSNNFQDVWVQEAG